MPLNRPHRSPSLLVIRPAPGSPIDTSNIVGRDELVAQMWRDTQAGMNLLMTDPRRMGKTAALSRYRKLAPKGAVTAHADFEAVADTASFVYTLMKCLREHLPARHRARNAIEQRFEFADLNATTRHAGVKAVFKGRHVTEIMTTTLAAVSSELGRDRLMITMDEVSIALLEIGRRDPDGAVQLLRSLRKSRQELPNIGWVLAGSVGFHHVLRILGEGEGAINDLVAQPVGPLDRKSARILADALFRGIERPPAADAAEAMVQVTGGIPFLIHYCAHLLRDGSHDPVSAHAVQQAMDNFIMDRDQSRAVTHFVTRLEPYYGDDVDDARAVLDYLCAVGPSDNDAIRGAVSRFDAEGGIERLRTLMDLLVDDHYLVKRQGVWEWRYPVLATIWASRRGL